MAGALSSDDPDRDPQSRIYVRILHHWEIGQNMPSKYATFVMMKTRSL